MWENEKLTKLNDKVKIYTPSILLYCFLCISASLPLLSLGFPFYLSQYFYAGVLIMVHIYAWM
jgi:hypothetical protein